MQQFQFTIEYVKLNLPFGQFLTLITMEEIIYRNYFTHSRGDRLPPLEDYFSKSLLISQYPFVSEPIRLMMPLLFKD